VLGRAHELIVPAWLPERVKLLAFSQTLLRDTYLDKAPRPGDFAVIPAGLPAISLGIADAALAALAGQARTRIILGRPGLQRGEVSRDGTECHALAAMKPGTADGVQT